MNFLFAWRYFRAKKSTNAINIIAWVSVAAIIVGTASLIIVLSVFNGLEGLVKSLYSSFYSEIKISPARGKFMQCQPSQLKALNALSGISAYSLEVEEKALLQYNSMQPVMLRGVDSSYQLVTGLASKLVKGKFDLGTEDHPGAVLGAGIENALGIESDRSVQLMTVYLFKNSNYSETADPIESLSTGNMAATGTFVIQQDFDNKYVITNLAFLKQQLGLKADEFSGIEIGLRDPGEADLIKTKINQLFGSSYLVQTRYEQNQSLYKVMRTEKWVIYAILTLILVVAAFNMVGALTMLVLEKKKDIQVLKAMGANDQLIQRIFLTEGLLLALIGGSIGILLAVSICWMQVKYKLVPLQGESFLIDYYPVKLVGTDFILVLCTIFLVAVLASWFPSRKAAVEPIELRS